MWWSMKCTLSFECPSYECVRKMNKDLFMEQTNLIQFNNTKKHVFFGNLCGNIIIIIIIIEGLSLLQSIPPTTADKQTQAQKRRGSRSRKLLGAKAARS